MEDTINQLIESSIIKPLSSEEERVISGYLKTIDESRAVEIIVYMIDVKSMFTISIPKSVIKTRNNAIKIFEHGITNSNAQSIKLWLEFAIPKIGIQRVINSIIKVDSSSNQIAQKSSYWLPKMIENNEKCEELFNKLKSYMQQ